MKAAFARMKLPVAVLLCGLSVATTVSAQTSWADWSSATIGAPGSATGGLVGVGVTYSGELDAAVTNGSGNLWSPASTWIGGASTASPNTVADYIRLNGDFRGTNTITFASAIENPLFAIYSLGTSNLPVSFTFNLAPTVQAGGPSAGFGGTSVTVSGNVMTGREGNGVVQFTGLVSSISWTTDVFENYFIFTVGSPGATAPVPEPSEHLMMLGGLALLVLAVRRRMAGPTA
jgi:hypothetical protein